MTSSPLDKMVHGHAGLKALTGMGAACPPTACLLACLLAPSCLLRFSASFRPHPKSCVRSAGSTSGCSGACSTSKGVACTCTADDQGNARPLLIQLGGSLPAARGGLAASSNQTNQPMAHALNTILRESVVTSPSPLAACFRQDLKVSVTKVAIAVFNV